MAHRFKNYKFYFRFQSQFNLKFTFCFTLFCCFFSISNLIGQNLMHYRLDDEDGLPSNEVYQVLQDDFGFMWIACDAGLFKYDGFKFKGYTSENQNSRSVSNLKKDSKGNIWCQNFTGQIFRVNNDSLKLFFDGSKTNSSFLSYEIDAQNKVWIVNNGQLHIFTNNGKIYSNSTNYKNNYWTNLYRHKNSIIATNIKNEIFSIDYKNLKIMKIHCSSDLGSTKKMFSHKNELYLLSEKNPERSYYVSKILKSKIHLLNKMQPIVAGGFHYFFKANTKNYFIGTSDGLILSSKNNFSFTESKRYFKGIKISDFFEDKEGNLWISTLQDGIMVVANKEIEYFDSQNSALNDRNIYYLTQNKGELLIGTYSGKLFKQNSKTNELSIYQDNQLSKYRAIRKIIVHKGAFYIACGPLRSVGNPKFNEIPSLNNIRDMVILDEKLYFITPERMGYLDLSKTSIEIKILRKNGGKKIVLDTSRKRLFIAFVDGLYEFKNNSLKELKNKNQSIFVADMVYGENKLWIGTMTEGVLEYALSSKNKEFKNVKQVIGKNTRSLLFADNKLWISNESGLVQYDPKSDYTKLFNKSDGLEFFEVIDMEQVDDFLYLATNKGLVKFPIQLRHYNTNKPSIKLTEIRLNNSIVPLSKSIELQANQLNLTIYFISTALRSRGDFFYNYRILNYDSKWKKQSSSVPFISINSLPPGNYILEIRSVNEDGVPSKTIQLDLKVFSPYYERWWFYLILSSLTATIIAFVFVLRIRFVKKQAIIKNKLISSQLTALKSQMNPHFMYNTLSSIQDFIWQNDLKNSNYFLSKFSMLMRKILEASDKEKITLSEEIELLTLYLELEKLRFGANFSFEIKLDSQLDSDAVLIPAMMIQPFVENAIKHGLLHKTADKKLSVEFKLFQNKIKCVVIDNGIGRVKASEIKERQQAHHTSFATKATQKRIELLSVYNASNYSFLILDLFNDAGEATGTQVEIILPLG